MPSSASDPSPAPMTLTTSLHGLAAEAEAALQARWQRRASGFSQAPGRVNLIGEHTDYNGGFVLPCALPFATVVAWAPRSDGLLRAVAVNSKENGSDEFSLAPDLQSLGFDPSRPWTAYLRGMARELRLRHGLAATGADIAIAGNVPQGSGLSSSASLCVALALALLAASGQSLPMADVARAAQAAENDFVGCHCGIMDQWVSAHAQAGHALLLDCRSLRSAAVALPPDSCLLIAHSRVHRGLVESAYNERRAACERAAQRLGLPSLRDARMADVLAAGLDDTTLRRARHVLSENDRTLATAQALDNGQLVAAGALMAASHASMRDDFEITLPAIDALAELMHHSIGGEGGARMTGGGFGGCVVGLMPRHRVADVREAVARNYRSPQGLPALLYECQAAAGAGAFLA